MAISDKTRKVLWGQSGSRCAICRIEFVVEKTPVDPHSVVGEECHIVSASPNGPRHDPSFKTEQFDAIENIILLCATHHKMVDDQPETYTADVLRSIKSNHEKWVKSKYAEEEVEKPIRIRRIKNNIPQFLARITSGKDLTAMCANTMGHTFDHDDGLSEEEVELVGGFVQEVSDWIDLYADLEPIERMRTLQSMQELINDLERHGFFVFAATEIQQQEGGKLPPSPWKILHLRVYRSSNPAIQTIGVPSS